MMPVRAWRFGTGLRPGERKRLGFGGGSIGLINSHKLSSSIGLGILLPLRSLHSAAQESYRHGAGKT